MIDVEILQKMNHAICNNLVSNKLEYQNVRRGEAIDEQDEERFYPGQPSVLIEYFALKGANGRMTSVKSFWDNRLNKGKYSAFLPDLSDFTHTDMFDPAFLVSERAGLVDHRGTESCLFYQLVFNKPVDLSESFLKKLGNVYTNWAQSYGLKESIPVMVEFGYKERNGDYIHLTDVSFFKANEPEVCWQTYSEFEWEAIHTDFDREFEE